MECNKSNIRYIPSFYGFTEYTPTVPSIYWDTYSQEQRIHELCKMFDKLICYADMLGLNVDDLKAQYEVLKSEFDEFKASGFLDYYEKQIETWINANMPSIIEKSIKMVWFGLTLDGHFVAYIPDSWDDIVFDTGADYELDTYGRLILRYIVDDSSDLIDQTPEIVRPSIDDYIYMSVKNIMNTLYATQ